MGHEGPSTRHDPPGSPGRARFLCRREGRDTSRAHVHEGTGTARMDTSLERNMGVPVLLKAGVF